MASETQTGPHAFRHWRTLVFAMLLGAPATASATTLDEAGLMEVTVEQPIEEPVDTDVDAPSWRTADSCEYRSQCRCNSYGTQCYSKSGYYRYNQWEYH